ncbi:hypothetical protein AB6Q13_07850 [Ralstonia solanacearum]|nr:hypothetical protein [Ralstonia solanacearum]MDB0566881.1 hypothetical protein [Ralstonia solanacearum]MDB0576680.1 hypothetical protein [Ralstonia solanacearum]
MLIPRDSAGLMQIRCKKLFARKALALRHDADSISQIWRSRAAAHLMSEENNIDLFNEHVSKIFALLYESFPVPVHISQDSFSYASSTKDSEGLGAVEEQYEPIMHAVLWLCEERYIRFKDQTMDGAFFFVTLSQKGLTALRAIPESLQGKEPLGKQITAAVKGGAVGGARKLAEQALLLGAKYAMNGMAGT